MEEGRHPNHRVQSAYDKHGECDHRILVFCRWCDLVLFEQRMIDHLKPNLNISKVANVVLPHRMAPVERYVYPTYQMKVKHWDRWEDLPYYAVPR